MLAPVREAERAPSATTARSAVVLAELYVAWSAHRNGRPPMANFTDGTLCGALLMASIHGVTVPVKVARRGLFKNGYGHEHAGAH